MRTIWIATNAYNDELISQVEIEKQKLVVMVNYASITTIRKSTLNYNLSIINVRIIT